MEYKNISSKFTLQTQRKTESEGNLTTISSEVIFDFLTRISLHVWGDQLNCFGCLKLILHIWLVERWLEVDTLPWNLKLQVFYNVETGNSDILWNKKTLEDLLLSSPD